MKRTSFVHKRKEATTGEKSPTEDLLWKEGRGEKAANRDTSCINYLHNRPRCMISSFFLLFRVLLKERVARVFLFVLFSIYINTEWLKTHFGCSFGIAQFFSLYKHTTKVLAVFLMKFSHLIYSFKCGVGKHIWIYQPHMADRAPRHPSIIYANICARLCCGI